MSRLIRTLALLLAITCTVWVVVLWRWQAVQHDMSVQDITTHLLLLPLTLFVLALLLRWAWRGAQARSAAREAIAAAAVPAPAPVAVPSADEAEQRATLQLLSAQLHSPAGRNAQAVLDAVSAGAPRPALDAELRDANGMPLLCARIAGLDTSELDLPPLQAALRAQLPAHAEAECSVATQRALAALAGPLQAALLQLQPWQARLVAADRQPAASALQVLPLWPAGWSPYEQAVAGAWLRRELGNVAERIVVQPCTQPGSSVQGWLDAERLLRSAAREGRSEALLLLACHSALDAGCVQALQQAGDLYTAQTPKAAIPGEAAVALLLAAADWPPAPDAAPDAPRPPRVHRAAAAQRDKSIDQPGRAGSTVAETCIEQALSAGPYAASAIVAAVHDADPQTARATEASAALLKQLPQLDAADDVHATGALHGRLGVAAVPIAVALAAARAARLEGPALALSVDDARQRLALVVQHVTETAAPAPGPAP